MMPLAGLPLLVAAMLLLWQAGGAPPGVDHTRLMRDVATLSSPAFEGRAAGSPGSARARRWLIDRFAEAGITPLVGNGYEQPFQSARGAAANVAGRIDGRAPDAAAIVVTAHYDHLGMRNGALYPGADDNASGVAALLAVAHDLSARQPRHPFILAALDAEEIGQRGAAALLRSGTLPRRIALNINLDMVSRSAAGELFAAGTSHSPWQLPILRGVQKRAAVTLRFGHDQPRRGDRDYDWTHASDHGPFHNARIPFVYFGVEDHPDYHKPTDTADRIDPRFFGDAVATIVDAVRAFDREMP